MKIIMVNDKMQTGYSYALSEPMGKNFDALLVGMLAQ